MKYNRIGKSGLKVSEIALGSWLTFGSQIDQKEAINMTKIAFDAGINYFDTADVYNAGTAEIQLGNALGELNRSHYVVATKAFFPMSEHSTDSGLSRKHIFDSLHGSLERLKLKYTDIFYCHRYDENTPLEETIEAIADAIKMGLTQYWGVSEWTSEQINRAVSICRARQWPLPIVNQPLYNLAARKVDLDVRETCIDAGMGLAVFSPLAGGILTGKYSNGTIPKGSRATQEGQKMFIDQWVNDAELLAKVDQLKPIAERYNLTQAQLSLAWLLNRDGVSSVIIGASRKQQLEENLRASEVVLEAKDKQILEQLFPPPVQK